MEDLTPRQIVAELDKYIIGQDAAKRSVAIALRNRWRRLQVAEGLREEIMPNNIILIGPTGVGKTEIARRLAKLADAPFLKVEASKFTEVGYVGRDVESMIRDLTEIAVTMVKAEKTAEVQEKAAELAEERILDALVPPLRRHRSSEQAETIAQQGAAFLASRAGQALPVLPIRRPLRPLLHRAVQGRRLQGQAGRLRDPRRRHGHADDASQECSGHFHLSLPHGTDNQDPPRNRGGQDAF